MSESSGEPDLNFRPTPSQPMRSSRVVGSEFAPNGASLLSPPAWLPLAHPTPGCHAWDAGSSGIAWPLGCLVEVFSDGDGREVLEFLQPRIEALLGKGRRIALIGPPPAIDSLEFLRAPIEGGRILRSLTGAGESGWELEQYLGMGGCDAAIVWLPSTGYRQLRKLKECSRHNNILTLAVRPLEACAQPGPAEFHVSFSSDKSNACVKYPKQSLRTRRLAVEPTCATSGVQRPCLGSRFYAEPRMR